MATLFKDSEAGNDANNGSSFALRFKSYSSGATAARTAPGDVIREKRSPAPTSMGQNASFTNKSPTVTLTTAVNATVDMCESGWTASANITLAYNTPAKEGTNAMQLTVGASFTTGKAAYKALGASTDFSGYKQLSFWVNQTSSGAGVNAGANMKICLCSDTTGDVIVDTFYVDHLGAVNRWVPHCVDKGSALGSAIQSVAIYFDSDPGAAVFRVDNIITCKDSTAADSLSLVSLIGKSTDPITAAWPIRSINGTTVTLDMGVGTAAATASRGYSGTTESVTCYKRECIRYSTTPPAAATTAVDAIQESGSAGSPITYSGGWDVTAMTTQEDYTFIDLRNGLGYYPYMTGKSYVTMERIIVVRANHAMVTGTGTNIIFTDMGAVDCSNVSTNEGCLMFDNGITESQLGWKWVVANGAEGSGACGVYADGNESKLYAPSGYCLSNGGDGVNLAGFAGDGRAHDIGYVRNQASAGVANDAAAWGGNLDVTFAAIADNGTYGIAFNAPPRGSYPAIFRAGTLSGNTSGSVSPGSGGNLRFVGVTMSDSTEVNLAVSYADAMMFSQDHDGVAGAVRIWGEGYYADRETGADRHTGSGGAWKMYVTSSSRDLGYPAWIPIGSVFFTGSGTKSVKVWVRRSNTGLTCGIRCRGGQVAGIASTVSASVTVGADTYEELTLTLTPSVAGVVQIELWAYGGTTYSCIADDMTVS